MGHIFISYSSADRRYAEELMDHLRNHGFDVWMDDRTEHAEHWLHVVEEALETCSAALVVMSPAARDSTWVEREILLGLRHQKPIIPLLLEGHPLPLLEEVPFEDVTGEQLPGDDFFVRLNALTPSPRRYGMAIAPTAAQVRRILDEEALPPAAPTLPHPPRRRRQISSVTVIGLLLVLGMAIGGVLLIQSSHDTAFERLLERARNFRGGNDDWDPHEETSFGIQLMLVPAGCFTMGSTDAQLAAAAAACAARGESEEACREAFAGEQPAHQQCFSEPFWIGHYLITNSDYERCVADEACRPALAADIPGANGPQKPVTGISLEDAQDYTRWLSDRTGDVFTLPTEIEWEYAARGPDGWAFPWGDDFAAGAANFCDVNCQESFRDTAAEDGFVESSRVDTYEDAGESWVGALDMAGNVWEWTASGYAAYPLSGEPDAPAPEQVIRGGAWNSPAHDLRATVRRTVAPETRDLTLGFRVVTR
ncbi:MAG: SUMF1/EgtB/PvdO family nonheme iron enzyme [Anaerolineae bacterium]|nr:SUMF1/EgtB/PvdO family nonheme iron enzyme [Anaerolineae bacterium]